MDSNEYQHRAHEAEDNAWATTSDDLRARWLNVAQIWLLLARDAGQRESAFRTVTEAGQKQLPSAR